MNRDARLIGLALLLWGFGEGLFFYIEPLYIEQLGATPVQIGALISVANVVRAGVYLPAGIVADRLPRKWVMAGGWATGLLGVLLVGLADSWRALVPGLLVYATSAYCIPVVNAYLAHTVGGKDLARTFTVVFAGYAAGGIISPAAGGWLAGVTTMRTVYFVSAFTFAISTLVVVQVSPQPVPVRTDGGRSWRSLMNRRYVRFAILIGLLFSSMYLAFPLAPNYLQDVGRWRVAHVGLLGSFQAVGTTLLNPLLGHLGGERDTRDRGSRPLAWWASGLVIGPGLVWGSVLVLLVAKRLPLLVAAFLLRGAYQGCRSLTQARASRLAIESERGLFLGATDTLVATAQVVAPYAAGLLYAHNPAYPLLSSLVLIPVVLLLSVLARGF